jgi:hypothetical protein
MIENWKNLEQGGGGAHSRSGIQPKVLMKGG